MLVMFIFYGLSGIIAYPVSLIADRLPGHKRKVWAGWYVLLALFCVFVLLAALLSAGAGVQAVSQHLISPP